MAFALEKISEEDQLRILNDAKNNDLRKFSKLDYAFRRTYEQFPENWAIDRDHDYYLIKTPVLTRSEIKGYLYYFYFQGTLYEIQTKGVFGNNMPMMLNPPPLESLLTDLSNIIRKAFSVHGYFGDGDVVVNSLNNAHLVESFGEDAQ